MTETMRRCKEICKCDDYIWNHIGDERIIEAWLVDGPPDGIVYDFKASSWKDTTELYDFCSEEDTYYEWLECFNALVTYAKETGDID